MEMSNIHPSYVHVLPSGLDVHSTLSCMNKYSLYFNSMFISGIISSIVHYNNTSHLPLYLGQQKNIEVLPDFDITTETIICLGKASISQNSFSSGIFAFFVFFGT